MKSRKKILVLILGSILVLLLLVGILILFVPKFIDSDFVKREIVTHLSKRADAQVEITAVDFSFFPRPHAVIRKASLLVAEKVSAEIESLIIYPKIWPLLSGKLRIAVLEAESPEINIKLPQSKEPVKEAPDSSNRKDLREKLALVLAPIISETEGLSLQVENGKVSLVKGEVPSLWFNDIHIQMDMSKQLKIDLTCKSNLWKGLSLKSHLDLKTFKGDGRIELICLRPNMLPDYILPNDALKVGNSEANVNIAFKTDLTKDIEAKIKGSAPLLPIVYNKKEVALKGVNIDGTLNITEGKTAISISKLNLDYPRLDLTGEFVMDKSTPRVSLRLEGREVDVPSIREVALSMGGNNSAVKDIFAIVKGGKVPLISLESNGKTLDDLGKLENILIKGSMLEGEIYIPGIDLNLDEVKGDALISEGILNGKHLQTRLGKTFGSKGNLRLGLGEDDDLFRLDIMIKADLTQTLSILKNLIKDESVTRELRRIDDIKGNATARLVLGETTSSIMPRVDASEFDLRAKYRQIPYPVEIRGTHFSYANSVVKAGELTGKLGKTSFSKISGMLDWHKELYMKVESAEANILLDEIYPWVSSFAGAREALKEIESLKGYVTLNTLDFKGPLLRPKAWRFKTECAIKDFILSSTQLPGPLTVAEGRVEADSQTLILKNARVSVLDANLDVSATAKGYMEGLNRLEATFEGNMGIKAIRSTSELINLPEDLKVISPVTISKAHLLWEKGSETSFKANLSAAKGPDISLSVLKTPAMLKIDNLTIKDDKSDASFGCNIQEDAVSIRFSGNLDKTSLDSFLAKNRLFNGWIKGNLWARIIPGSAIETTIEGHLKGGDIAFHELNLPAKLMNFSIEAGQQRVILKSADLAVDDTQISATGTLDLSEQGILFNLGLSSDDFDLGDIIKAFDKKGKETKGKRDKNRWSLPVKGTTHVKLNSLTYAGFRWEPFHCNISAEGDTVNVTVTKGNLCGISTPGTLNISPKGIGLDFKLLAKNKSLTETIACVSKKSVAIDGTLDFESEIKGEGMGNQLIKSLHGPFKFTAKDGRINRDPLLSRILSLLNVTEIFSGKLPDLASEGFAYNSITGEGNLKDGKVNLAKVLVDGSTMNLAGHGDIDLLENKLNLKVFAAPFKTVDRIIRILPIIGYVLNDKLISIAMKVTGKLQDPKVEYLPVDEIGSGLLGIMKRTLEVPVKVIEPVIPMEEKKKE